MVVNDQFRQYPFCEIQLQRVMFAYVLHLNHLLLMMLMIVALVVVFVYTFPFLPLFLLLLHSSFHQMQKKPPWHLQILEVVVVVVVVVVVIVVAFVVLKEE